MYKSSGENTYYDISIYYRECLEKVFAIEVDRDIKSCYFKINKKIIAIYKASVMIYRLKYSL